MAQPPTNTFINDDAVGSFFGDRKSDYEEIIGEKQKTIEDGKEKNNKLVEKKRQILKDKEDLDEQSKVASDKSDELLRQLKEQVELTDKIEAEKTELYLKELNKNEIITQEIKNIEEFRFEVNNLERELTALKEVHDELTTQQQDIAQQLLDIKEKKAGNVSMDNYLQLSRQALQRYIQEVVRELRQQEEILNVKLTLREEFEKKIEDLLRQIARYEEEIKLIDKQIEEINIKQSKLEADKNALEKKIEEFNATILELEAMRNDKLKKVARLEKEIQACQAKIKELQIEIEELREKIRINNETLEKMKHDLDHAQIRLEELDARRKELENEKRRHEKELQGLEDERIDRANKLKRIQQKLLMIEELFNRAVTKIEQLQRQNEQQSTELKRLETERDRLDQDVTRLTEQCAELREKKDLAQQARQTAEVDHKEAERSLAQLKKLERDHHNEYEKSVNEEQRIQTQLSQAQLEESQAAQQEAAAEAKLKSLEPMEMIWNGLASLPIPFVPGIAQSKVQEFNRARAEFDQARQKHEDKKAKVAELRDKHKAAQFNVRECNKKYNDTKKDLAAQRVLAQQKAALFNQCKYKSEQLIEQHRDASRKQKDAETNLRMVSTKLQKVQTQLSTTENDLKHYQTERTTYDNQKTELKGNIEDMNVEIEKHQRSIDEHHEVMRKNHAALSKVKMEYDEQNDKVQQLKGNYENFQRLQNDLINSEKAKVREVSHQNTLLEAEKKTADQLKEEIDVKTQTLNNLKEQLTSMTNELKTVVENSKRLQEEKNKHKGMVQDMHRQLTDAEIEHRETRFKVQAQEDKVKGLHQNIDLLNKRDDQLKLDVNHLEDKLKQNINEIEKRKISMADLNDKVIKGRKDQENGSTIIKISEEELLLIKNDIQQLDAQISINDKKFSDLRDDLRQSNEAFARNEILKAFTYEKLQEVEMEITDLKKRYCEQQKKYDAQIHELIEQRRNVQQREQIPVSVQPIRRQN